MPTDIHLGQFELSLNVLDISRSASFYENLGFRKAGGSLKEKCIVMQHENCRIALYQGYLNNNLLNFRGGDISAITARLEEMDIPIKRATADDEGNKAVLVEHPDGNEIYLVHHPGESS